MISSASGTCAATSRALHTAVASAYSPAVLPAFGRSSANDDFTTCMRPLLLSGGRLRLLFVNHRFLAAGNWTLLSIECALLWRSICSHCPAHRLQRLLSTQALLRGTAAAWTAP